MAYRVVFALLMLAGAVSAPIAPDGPLEPLAHVRVTAIPTRAAGAMTGSEFARRTTGRTGRERQRAALDEIERGNIPDFLRTLVPVQLSYRPPGRPAVRVTVWVMPDYLAIGSDDDFLYIPLSRGTAMEVAREFGFVLPTPRIVDAVYDQATYHLDPRPLPPGPKMRSSVYYLRHQALIDAQRAGVVPGSLISGHKKDVVLTNRLRDRGDRIAIYGWHRAGGRPIQPLSTVHGSRYADYSHGLRLVWQTVLVDGEARSVYDVLGDPATAPALTYEGTIPNARRLMSTRPPWRAAVPLAEPSAPSPQ